MGITLQFNTEINGQIIKLSGFLDAGLHFHSIENMIIYWSCETIGINRDSVPDGYNLLYGIVKNPVNLCVSSSEPNWQEPSNLATPPQQVVLSLITM